MGAECSQTTRTRRSGEVLLAPLKLTNSSCLAYYYVYIRGFESIYNRLWSISEAQANHVHYKVDYL